MNKMHKHDVFTEGCSDCRPAALDLKTGQLLPDDHPTSRMLSKIFDEAPREEKEAFFRFSVKNSRDAKDLMLVERFMDKVHLAQAN